ALFGRPGGVDVDVALPAGSTLEGEAGMGDVTCAGHLAARRFKPGFRRLHVDNAHTVAINTRIGDATIGHARGGGVARASGESRRGGIDGPGIIRISNGVTGIGEPAGDLRSSGANGNISVDRALAAVTATTANGSIRLGEVVRGTVNLETAAGS